jgi:tetratricopeptide (TPR) repeat protein
VYALGVVLYELLTGQSPYKSASTQPMALAKEICETDPERPSTVVGRTLTLRPTSTAVIEGTDVSSAAAVNAVEATPPALNAMSIKRLQRGLRGDLDNIVLMALRKDPARRYASAEQLAEDVKRFGQNLPVSARADTFSYRATKFVQRNRWAVGFAFLSFVGLIGGVVTATQQANIAKAAQARAERHFSSVRTLGNTYLFDFHKSLSALPGTVDVQRQLVATAVRYLDDLRKDAGEDTALLAEIGAGFHRLANIQGGATQVNMGLVEDAEKSFERATDALRRVLVAAPTNVDYGISLVKALSDFSVHQAKLKHLERSKSLYAEAISVAKRLCEQFPNNVDVKIRQFALLANRPAIDIMLGLSTHDDATAIEARLDEMKSLQTNTLSKEQRELLEKVLIRSYSSLALDASTQGRAAGAIKRHLRWRVEALDLQRVLAKKNANQPDAETTLTTAILYAAEAYANDRQEAQASSLFAEAITRGKALMKGDIDNEISKVTLLQSYSRAAVFALNNDKFADVASLSTDGLATYASLKGGARSMYDAKQGQLVSMATSAAAKAASAHTAPKPQLGANLCSQAKQEFHEAKQIAAADPTLLGTDDEFFRSVAAHVEKCKSAL